MCGTKFREAEKLWNGGFDGIVVRHNHESGVGVFGMCDLDTGKHTQHKKCEVVGDQMHKNCVKEDAASEEESSMSDNAKNKNQEEVEEKPEEELSD